MKLGIHLSTFTKKWEDDVLEYIPSSSKIGYKMVEIPLMNYKKFDINLADKLLKKYGLTCTFGTGMNFEEDISSVQKDIRQAGVKRLIGCIDIASKVESDCLAGVLHSPWGLRENRNDLEDRYKYCIDNLQSISDYAKKRGVYLSLELLNRYESSFINNVDEGIDLLKRINRENIKLHYDTFHAHIEESNQDLSIQKASQYIWHVHLCDNNRSAPGSGGIDFYKILSTLHKIKYDRNLVIENFVIPNCDIAKEAYIWSSKFHSPIENAKYAFDYINNIMEKVWI